MALVPDPVPVTNLFFSALIVIVGLLAYGRTKKETPLYIAGAFLLFAISHLAIVLGFDTSLATPLLVLRIVGYLLILWVLYLWCAKDTEKRG